MPDSPAARLLGTYFHDVLKVQDVAVDPATRRVWRDEREIVFSRKEFDLLHFLMQRAGSVVSRDELMLTVWNTTFWTSSKTIDVHLGWVRRKLGDDPSQPEPDHHGPRARPPLRDGMRRARPTPGDDDETPWRPHRLTGPPRGPYAAAGELAPVVAVVGGGQLARMMAEPAAALGIPLRLLAEAPGVSAAQVIPDHTVGDYTDLATLRGARRRLPRSSPSTTSTSRPTTCTRSRTAGIAVRPGPGALVHAQDKVVMREAPRPSSACPCPRHPSSPSADEVAARSGFPCVLKTTRGGYDGKGVWFVRTPDDCAPRVRGRRRDRRTDPGRGAGRLPPRAVRAGGPLARAARRRRTRSSSRCSATASATRSSPRRPASSDRAGRAGAGARAADRRASST